MFIDCTAPFRTQFNLRGMAEFDGHARALPVLAARLGPRWTPGPALTDRAPDDCFERYADEAGDDVPIAFKPLIILDGLEEDGDVDALGPGLRLSHVRAELFDNTIALLRYRIEGPGVAPFITSRAYSRATHQLARRLSLRANRLADDLIAEQLQVQTAPGEAEIVARPGSFLVFDDMNALVRPDGSTAWSEDASPVIWTNRTVVVAGESDLAALGQAGGLTRVPSPILGLDIRLRFGAGTVFVVADADSYTAANYQTVMGWMQFVTAQLDVFRRIFFRAHQRLTSERRSEAFAHRLNAIKAYSTNLVESYTDLTFGVQHERRFLLDTIAACYEVDRLIEVAKERVRMVIDRVGDIRAETSARGRRFFEKAAFFIGSVSVLDFVVNLLWFSKGDYTPTAEWPKDIFQPLVIIRGFSSDLVVAVAAVLIFILLAARLRARE